MAHFFAKAKVMRPTPRIIRVTGQGNGKPIGLGFCRIIKIESKIRRAPEITKHTFARFFRLASDRLMTMHEHHV
jgi:hypothetical protein